MTEREPDEPSDLPTAPRPALSVVDYSTPTPVNRSARTAMLFAVLSFIPFVPGILAIRYGRRGVREAEADPKLGGRSTARAATIIGVISVLAWTVLSILAVPATIQARRQALRVHCMSNLRQVGMAMQLYAAANQGHLPPNLDALVAARIIPAAVLTCPACAGDPSKPAASTGAFGKYNYVYIGGGRLNAMRSVATTPVVYEPLTNHADPGINILYADGHVELHRGPGVAVLLQQMAAMTQATTPLPATTTAPRDAQDVEP